MVRTTEQIARIGTSSAPGARALLALAMSGIGHLPALRGRMAAAAAGTR